MSKKIKRHGITNHVARQRAAIARLEGMLVNPLTVGAANLLVHETVRRLPDFDVRAPAHWHAPHAQPVVNLCSRAHRDRQRSDDVKIQPRRCEGVEVRGVGKKRKQFLWRQRQPEFG